MRLELFEFSSFVHIRIWPSGRVTLHDFYQAGYFADEPTGALHVFSLSWLKLIFDWYLISKVTSTTYNVVHISWIDSDFATTLSNTGQNVSKNIGFWIPIKYLNSQIQPLFYLCKYCSVDIWWLWHFAARNSFQVTWHFFTQILWILFNHFPFWSVT